MKQSPATAVQVYAAIKDIFGLSGRKIISLKLELDFDSIPKLTTTELVTVNDECESVERVFELVPIEGKEYTGTLDSSVVQWKK